jgi:multidrug efflux pump subunit AcrA (membrane-fusion protein)
MTVRKSWIIAVAIIVTTFFAFRSISKAKQKVKKTGKEVVKVAIYKVVKNQKLPLIVEASGQLKPKHTFDMYSEVTGVLKSGGKEFRTGTKFRKGELMIHIDDSEVKAQLYSQRSEFQNLITSLLPDIKIEFPSEFKKWENYLINFEIEKKIKPLPKVSSKKEKYFVSGKKVFTQYYAIKNLEARYAKYNLYAPFAGIVTETNLKPGGLVRSGQKMGVFSNMESFELEVSVKASDIIYVNIGDNVKIYSSDKTNAWNGKVMRINGAIDLKTQTVSVFVEVNGEGLKAGMYLDVELESMPINHSILLSRNILHNNTFVYLVKDSVLVEYEINPVKFSEKSVMIDNLKDGAKLVFRNIPGAFPGMRVNPKEIK